MQQKEKAISGNMSVQLKKLEKEKRITITKGFLNDYQHASVEITNTGIDAFEEYIKYFFNFLSAKVLNQLGIFVR